LKVKIVSFKIATIRAGRVAEVVRAVTQQAWSPEFKPQCHQKRKIK
jgi:hypothetical protein